jgi:hypothetical protein
MSDTKDDVVVLDELTAIKQKKEDLKKILTHFYGELNRVKKNIERKYKFPITCETCKETLSQCYEYIDVIEALKKEDPNSSDEYEVELETASMFLTDIEAFSHELKGQQEKPTEILETRHAVSVTSPEAAETKGKEKKTKNQSKAAVKEIISGQDVSKEDLYQIKDKPEAPPIPEEKGVITGDNIIEVAFLEAEAEAEADTQADELTPEELAELVNIPSQPPDDTIVISEPDEIPTPLPDTSNELAITQPVEADEINLQVVVDKEENELTPEEEAILSNNVPLLTEEDLSGSESDTALNDIELITEDDGQKSQIVDDEIAEGTKERSIKAVSRTKTNPFRAKLQKKNIDENLISAIKLFPYNENDDIIKREYLLSRNDMLASPHASRVYLLMSGYYTDITSFGNWDCESLERVMRNSSYDFVDKEVAILNTIYNHIVYFSYTKTRPSFEDWLASVKFPDYDTLFFALFDANYPGINYFRLECPYCGNENVTVGKETKDLVVAVDRNYSDDDLTKQLSVHDAAQLDSEAYLPKWANTTKVRKMARNSKILFEYMVPTLLDYVQMISTVKRIAKREDKFIDLSKILVPGDEAYLRLLLYLYVKTVGLPSPIYGDPAKPKEPTSYKYIGLDNKGDVIEIINSLDIEDYASLFIGEPLQDLMLKRSLYYYVKDSQCPECKNIIKYVNLGPRNIFFSRITDAVRNLTL